jgi:hypothetical protein
MVPFGKPRTIPEACHDGMTLVVSPESTMPCRCVKCNTEYSLVRISRKISTISAWYPLFASAGWNSHCADDLPIYVGFNICIRHYLEWLCRLAIVCIIAISNLICLILCGLDRAASPVLDILTIALPLMFILATLGFRPILRPRRVHHGLAWFTGAGPAFLDSLPELKESPAQTHGILKVAA